MSPECKRLQAVPADGNQLFHQKFVVQEEGALGRAASGREGLHRHIWYLLQDYQ